MISWKTALVKALLMRTTFRLSGFTEEMIDILVKVETLNKGMLSPAQMLPNYIHLTLLERCQNWPWALILIWKIDHAKINLYLGDILKWHRLTVLETHKSESGQNCKILDSAFHYESASSQLEYVLPKRTLFSSLSPAVLPNSNLH